MMIKPIIKLVEHKTSSSDDVLEKLEDDDYKENKIKLVGKKIESKEDLKLEKELKDGGILTIKKLISGLEISPTSYIGSVEFSEFIVRIRPKYSVEPEKINSLLDYIWNVKPQIKIKFLESSVDVEEEEKTLLIEVIIKSLIQQCELLLKRGLLKSYIVHEDNVPFLRGKLLMMPQIQNSMKKNIKFACQFDELEHDNLENQILLAALSASHNITNDKELKRKLRILMYQYSAFASHSPILAQDFDKIRYNRLNQYYEHAHDLSRLILEASGFREYRKEKRIKIKPFFINMDEVFAKFVERLIRFYYSNAFNYNVKAQKTTEAWQSDRFKDKNMRTDILVSDSNDQTKKFILDTKYKDELSSGDRYQIGFYIHEFKQKEGTALLPEFNVDKDEILTSEKGIIINVKHIDINKILDIIYNEKNSQTLHNKINEIIRSDMQVSFK